MIGEQNNIKTERQRDRETERQRDRETEGQKDRQTERQKDRRTNSVYFQFSLRSRPTYHPSTKRATLSRSKYSTTTKFF
jgi:hypothetical protein